MNFFYLEQKDKRNITIISEKKTVLIATHHQKFVFVHPCISICVEHVEGNSKAGLRLCYSEVFLMKNMMARSAPVKYHLTYLLRWRGEISTRCRR